MRHRDPPLVMHLPPSVRRGTLRTNFPSHLSSMKVLALDIGTVRIGVAVSDDRGIVATPVETVEARPIHKAVARIDELAQEYGVEAFVVGLPVDLNGAEGRAVKKTRKFVEKVVAKTPLPVHEWDERMSSLAAERSLLEADVSRKKRKAVIDQVAATLILQSWLDSRRR